MILQELLGPVPVATFLEEHYLKLPYSCPGGCLPWTELGQWPMVESLLQQPGVDVLAGREGKQWPGPMPPTPEQARRLLTEGYTLRLRKVERHDSRLAELAH